MMNKNYNQFENWNVQNKYEIIKKIGVGSYGSVVKAKDIKTGEFVAIKKIGNLFNDLIDGKRILREICLLRKLKHPNIVNIKEILKIEDKKNFNEIYLVLEYLDLDLKKLFNSNYFLEIKHIKKITYQMIIALKYLHSAGVLHRDLKPANVLINKSSVIKICDFGLARSVEDLTDKKKLFKKLESNENDINEDDNKENNKIEKPKKKKKKLKDMKIKTKLTSHVVTRWYRAPELILIEKNYDNKIDVWSVGCIYAELLNTIKDIVPTHLDRKALFPGNSCFPLSPVSSSRMKKSGYPVDSGDQLKLILKVLGTPNKEELSFITDEKALEYINSFPFIPKNDLTKKFPNIDKGFIDIMEKMLKFNPNHRYTIDELLEHEIFQDIRDKSLEIVENEKFHFEFEEKEINSEEELRNYFIEEINLYK